MQINVIERGTNGTPSKVESADGRYSWFWGSDGYIHDKQAGRSIYQMTYIKSGSFGSDPLPESVRADALAFWAALSAEQKAAAQAEAERRARADAEEEAARPKRTPAEIAERERLAREFDLVQNEGGEGYNPYR